MTGFLKDRNLSPPPQASLIGHVDFVSSQRLSGWALSTESPETPQAVEILRNSEVIGCVYTDQHRDDILRNFGAPKAGFFIEFPENLNLQEGEKIRCRIFGASDYLPGPQTVTIGRGDGGSGRFSLDPGFVFAKKGRVEATVTKVAVLAVYSAHNASELRHFSLLSWLRREGYTVIVSIASDQRIATIHSEIADFCDAVVLRSNVGWDFGSWRVGLLSFIEDLSTVKELLLINDSILGPLNDLSDIMPRLRAHGHGLSALTDSWDQSYHLQSYFLLFKGDAVKWGIDFLLNYEMSNDKTVVIRDGELGLSLSAVKNRIPLSVAFPYEKVVELAVQDIFSDLEKLATGVQSFASKLDGLFPEKEMLDDATKYYRDFWVSVISSIRSRRPLNPTHYFWHTLVARMGFPFLKMELIVKNPVGLPNLGRISELSEKWPPHVQEAIVESQKRYSQNLALCTSSISWR